MKKYLLVEEGQESPLGVQDSTITAEQFVSTASQEHMSADRIPRGIEVEENRIFFYCPVGSQRSFRNE